MDTLTSTHEMVENAEPISAHPDRLKDQLAEVKVSHPENLLYIEENLCHFVS